METGERKSGGREGRMREGSRERSTDKSRLRKREGGEEGERQMRRRERERGREREREGERKRGRERKRERERERPRVRVGYGCYRPSAARAARVARRVAPARARRRANLIDGRALAAAGGRATRRDGSMRCGRHPHPRCMLSWAGGA
ncbi:hypothetical protein R5R35_004011 [Gryllus longicercus]|uniref:Uncharacterized protein n=1 Tax=Gryllus longicercus TaxID=2509291 RepID=A0AAN9Z3S1_9ORTH